MKQLLIAIYLLFSDMSFGQSTTVTIQLYDASATDMEIQYSASSDFSSPTIVGPVNFASSLATVKASLPTALTYYRWLKRKSGVVVATGPTQIFVYP